MKTFSNIELSYMNQLRINKLKSNTHLFYNISCDFCLNIQNCRCLDDLPNIDKCVDFFIEKGWDELITPEKTGISCPSCIEKWKGGNFYTETSLDTTNVIVEEPNMEITTITIDTTTIDYM